jgi:hypothetical protein
MMEESLDSYTVLTMNTGPPGQEHQNFVWTIKFFSLPSLGLHNAHPLLALKISRKILVRVYNVHGL